MLLRPGEYVQVRAALGGSMTFQMGGTASEYGAWLLQLKEDILWLADSIEKENYVSQQGYLREGRLKLDAWHEDGTLVHMLDPQRMRWFIMGAGYVEGHATFSDPGYGDSSGARENSSECVCV